MSARPLCRVLLLIAVLLAVASCAGETSGEGSCAVSIKWHGDTYFPSTLPKGQAVHAARGLGLARLVCEPGDSVSIRALHGVDPRVAVLSADDARVVYLATGYPILTAQHPLHATFRQAIVRDLRPLRRTTCPRPSRKVRAFSGTANHHPHAFGPLHLRLDDGRQAGVEIVPSTRIVGMDRNGAPYLERGQAIRVTGRTCRARNGVLIVAREIRPA